MGHRTVVVLSNDRAHEWKNDPELGNKISTAAAYLSHNPNYYFPYGEVVEQVHADVQTVAVLDGYGGTAVAHGNWRQNESEEDKNLRLLKEFADKLGYRVVKKSKTVS